MPFKDFAAGDILSAADVDNFLMRQTVMVFDDATDRSTQLGTAVAEGMLAYTKDDNAVQVYDSTQWVPVDTTISSINGTAVVMTLTSSTATSYDVASSDQGKFLQFTNGVTVTFSTATAFTAGQQVQILCDGTATTIEAGSGVVMAGAGTLGTANSFTVGSQYEAVAVVAVGTNAYRVIGNVSAV